MTAYSCTQLIGNESGCLDYIDGSTLSAGDTATTAIDNTIYKHQVYQTSDNIQENSPYIIIPDTNKGTNYWLLTDQESYDYNSMNLIWRDDWTTGSSYSVDDLVRNDSKTYKCIVDHIATADNEPANASYWIEYEAEGLTTNFQDDWSDSSTYAVDDVAIYDSRAYRCIVAVDPASATTPPDDTTHWTMIADQPPASVAGNYVQYYIKKVDGIAITDVTQTLTLEAHQIVNGADSILEDGDVKLYDGVLVCNTDNDYESGSDGYTAVCGVDQIDNSLLIELKDGYDGDVYDSVTLINLSNINQSLSGSGSSAIGSYEPMISFGNSGAATFDADAKTLYYAQNGAVVSLYGHLEVDTITVPNGEFRIALPPYSDGYTDSTYVSKETQITASDAAGGDYFGRSCALSSDGSILAVGASYWEGASGTNRGGVYIYDWSGSSWTQRGSVIEASDAADSDYFGVSCTLSSDGSVLAVGAYLWEGASGGNRGGVYIYDWSGSAWTQRGSVIEASDAGDSDHFGISCALSSDGSILTIGAHCWDGASGADQGGVYVYDWSGSAWTQRGSMMEAFDSAGGDYFGISCALSGDGSILAIGSHCWEGTSGTNRGGVYIYDWSGSSWTQRGSIIEASDAADNDYFGISCALSSDGSILTIGANTWEGASGADCGGVYIYDWSGSAWTQRGSVIEASDAGNGDYFGMSCALSNDGSILAIGARDWDGSGGANQGCVYIYDYTDTSPLPSTTTVSCDATINHYYIDSNLTNFPVAFKFGENSFFFDDLDSNSWQYLHVTQGGTECYVEVDVWDVANERARIYAKIPTLSSTVDTVITIAVTDTINTATYVGETGDAAAQSVWDSNYLGVYHFSQDPTGGSDCILDSTSNGYDGTPDSSFASYQLAYNADRGNSLSFTENYVELPTAYNTLGTASYTIESFVEILEPSGSQDILFSTTNNSSGMYHAYKHLSTNELIQFMGGIEYDTTDATYSSDYYIFDNSLPSGNTQYIYHATYFPDDSVSDAINHYAPSLLDGASQGSGETQTAGSSTYVAGTGIPTIGDHPSTHSTSLPFCGRMYELKISDIRRSDAWLKASDASDNGFLVSYSITTPESVDVPIAGTMVTSGYPSVGTVGYQNATIDTGYTEMVAYIAEATDYLVFKQLKSGSTWRSFGDGNNNIIAGSQFDIQINYLTNLTIGDTANVDPGTTYYFLPGATEPVADVVTVGQDGLMAYDYSSIATAVSDVVSDTLILIYPGTYNEYINILKSVYIHGMGSSPTDVIVNNVNTGVNNTVYIHGSSIENLIIENITIISGSNVTYDLSNCPSYGRFALYKRNDTSNLINFQLNKVKLSMTSLGDDTGWNWRKVAAVYGGSENMLSNVTFNRDKAAVALQIGSYNYVSKAYFTYQDSDNTGACTVYNLSNLDYPTTTFEANADMTEVKTAGYGCEYGDYLITSGTV